MPQYKIAGPRALTPIFHTLGTALVISYRYSALKGPHEDVLWAASRKQATD